MQNVPKITSLRAFVALPLLVLSAGCAPTAAPAARPAAAPAPVPNEAVRVVGYYAGWTAARGFLPADIPADAITHVNYAFAGIAPDGTLVYRSRCIDLGECEAGEEPVPGWEGAFAGLRALKGLYPHVRVLVSIGGWSGSGRFSDVALTPASRQRFVRSAVQRFLDDQPGVFDGFDLDWEYPVAGGEPGNARRPEDRRNFTLLLEEFRRQLDARDSRSLLTIATAAGPSHLENLELERIQEVVDWINVMTYDYHTGGAIAHFNAPLYAGPDDPTPHLSIDATVDAYLAAGARPGKLVLGVPFFGRGYAGVPGTGDGLYQPAGTVAAGMADSEDSDAADGWGVGGVRYDELAREARRRGFERHWHEVARVPWLYDPATRVWISYDDPRSLREKAEYARDRGLGGVMIWELSADDGTLLEAVRDGLGLPAPDGGTGAAAPRP